MVVGFGTVVVVVDVVEVVARAAVRAPATVVVVVVLPRGGAGRPGGSDCSHEEGDGDTGRARCGRRSPP